MAIMIKKGTDLEQELATHRSKMKTKLLYAFLCFCGCFLMIITANITETGMFIVVGALAGVGVVIFFLSGSSHLSKINILQMGIQGERATAEIIRYLPDTYTGFQNLTVSHQGKTSELDLLLVGPTGVYIIETKNLNGSVYGDAAQSHWTQHKVGRGGTPYSKQFYNPIKQVNTHVYRLAGTLKRNGIHIYVNAMVYFANSETDLHITGDTAKTPVFWARANGANQMIRNILAQPQTLSVAQCQQVVNLLKNI